MNNIRFADKEKDKKFFDNLLHDTEAREKLGVRGGIRSGGIIKNDTWNATFVYCFNQEAVGFIKMSSSGLKDLNYIDDIFVMKRYRRNGIGEVLLKFAEEFMYDNWPAYGAYAMTIQNGIVGKLLKKNGYKKMGTYKEFTVRQNKRLDQSFWLKKY